MALLPIALALDLLVGTEGLEPSRLAAHDPKSCSSASSDTSPQSRSAPPLSIPTLARIATG